MARSRNEESIASDAASRRPRSSKKRARLSADQLDAVKGGLSLFQVAGNVHKNNAHLLAAGQQPVSVVDELHNQLAVAPAQAKLLGPPPVSQVAPPQITQIAPAAQAAQVITRQDPDLVAAYQQQRQDLARATSVINDYQQQNRYAQEMRQMQQLASLFNRYGGGNSGDGSSRGSSASPYTRSSGGGGGGGGGGQHYSAGGGGHASSGGGGGGGAAHQSYSSGGGGHTSTGGGAHHSSGGGGSHYVSHSTGDDGVSHARVRPHAPAQSSVYDRPPGAGVSDAAKASTAAGDTPTPRPRPSTETPGLASDATPAHTSMEFAGIDPSMLAGRTAAPATAAVAGPAVAPTNPYTAFGVLGPPGTNASSLIPSSQAMQNVLLQQRLSDPVAMAALNPANPSELLGQGSPMAGVASAMAGQGAFPYWGGLPSTYLQDYLSRTAVKAMPSDFPTQGEYLNGIAALGPRAYNEYSTEFPSEAGTAPAGYAPFDPTMFDAPYDSREDYFGPAYDSRDDYFGAANSAAAPQQAMDSGFQEVAADTGSGSGGDYAGAADIIRAGQQDYAEDRASSNDYHPLTPTPEYPAPSGGDFAGPPAPENLPVQVDDAPAPSYDDTFSSQETTDQENSIDY